MEEKIKFIIEREFNAKVLEIKRITEGYSHYMYEVMIDKNPLEVIIRFSNNIDKSVNLAKEKYVIDKLKEKGIPVPEIYSFYHPEKKEDGYIILEKFNGERLDLIWDSLSKKEKIQITKELGKLLSKIHEIKLPKYGYIEEGGNIDSEFGKEFKFRKEGEEINYSPFLRQVLMQSLKDFARLLSYKAVDPKFASDWMFYLSKNLNKIEFDKEPTLIHGDYMTGHIFVEKINNEYKIQGIIDFEFAESTSPEYDFIKLHRQGFFEDEELKKALKESYGDINEEAVEMHRLMRDIGFSQVVLDAGNKELAEKTLKSVEEKIKRK